LVKEEGHGATTHHALTLCSAEAAIQVQYAICCIGVFCEKGSSVSNLVGCAEAAEGYSCFQFLLVEIFDHVGVDVAGQDGVDANPEGVYSA